MRDAHRRPEHEDAAGPSRRVDVIQSASKPETVVTARPTLTGPTRIPKAPSGMKPGSLLRSRRCSRDW